MKKPSFTGKSKAELDAALLTETGVVRAYRNRASRKGSLKEYRAARKNIARIHTARGQVDKNQVVT